MSSQALPMLAAAMRQQLGPLGAGKGKERSKPARQVTGEIETSTQRGRWNEIVETPGIGWMNSCAHRK